MSWSSRVRCTYDLQLTLQGIYGLVWWLSETHLAAYQTQDSNKPLKQLSRWWMLKQNSTNCWSISVPKNLLLALEPMEVKITDMKYGFGTVRQIPCVIGQIWFSLWLWTIQLAGKTQLVLRSTHVISSASNPALPFEAVKYLASILTSCLDCWVSGLQVAG